jgi:hypothetical protein
MSVISKKLTDEELQQIKTIRQQYTNLALALGNVELQKINIENEKLNLMDALDQLKEAEMKIAKELTEKYGEGASINMETGDIS